MNTITLGGKPIYDPPPGGRPSNEFVMHSGASRPGVGRFLMLRSDWTALPAGVSTLVMGSALPDSSRAGGVQDGISFKVNTMVAAPYSVAVSNPSATSDADSPMDLVEVYVCDLRFSACQTQVHAVNVVNQSTYSGNDAANIQFYPSTLSGGTERSWSSAMTLLEIDTVFDGTAPLPSWNPRNLIYDAVQGNRMIDDVAARLRLVIGYDPTKAAINTYQGLLAYVPGDAGNSSDNQSLFSQLDGANLVLSARTSDPDETKQPTSFSVCFKAVLSTGSADPYLTRYYQKSVTVGGQGPTAVPLHVGEYPALYDPTPTIQNQTELDEVAADIAAREYALMSARIKDVELAGIWPFTLDGAIRGIKWVSGPNGAKTILRFNNSREFSPIDDTRKSLETLTNQMVTGLGAASASMGSGGTRYVAASGPSTVRMRITGVSGSYPVWSYTCQRVTHVDSSKTDFTMWVTDGVDINGVYNRFEWTPGAYPLLTGNGVYVANSTGAVSTGTSTSAVASLCIMRSIGIGAVVDVSTDFDVNDPTDPLYSFAMALSAQPT